MDENYSYRDRYKAIQDSKAKRQRKLQKYLKEKFKRNFKRLPHLQNINDGAASPLPELKDNNHAVSNFKVNAPQDEEVADRVLRRLASFTPGAWLPPVPTPAKPESVGREESSLSVSSVTKLPSVPNSAGVRQSSNLSKTSLQRTPSNHAPTSRALSDKQALQKTTSMLLLDRRRSLAFLEMPEDLQAIIASHSSDAAVEIAKLQLASMERSGSLLSEEEMEFRANSVRKLSLEEMVARLPYGPHFQQFGVADMDQVDQDNICDVRNTEDSSTENFSKTRMPLDRRIIEYNDLSVDDDEVPCNQLKLVVIGHPISAQYELTALLTTAINMLSDRCRSVGMSLVVFNSSWGHPNEIAPEDQTYEQLKALEEFLKPDGSLIFVLILLNDKFGQFLLPEKMSEDLYSFLYESAYEAQEKAMEQLAALNKQQKEAKERLSTAEATARRSTAEQQQNETGITIEITKADLGQVDNLDEKAEAGNAPVFSDDEDLKSKHVPSETSRSNAGGASTAGESDVTETTPKERKFRKTVRSLQNLHLVLRNVVKDFDPYKNDPVTLSKWYAQKAGSQDRNYYLVDHRIRYPNVKDTGSAEYLEERMKVTALIQKYAGKEKIFHQSGYSHEVRCVLKHLGHAETHIAVRRFVDFNPSDREGVVKFANYNRRKNGLVDYDPDAQAQMEELQKLIKTKISSDFQIVSAVRWGPQGLNPTTSYEHLAYVEKVVSDTVNQATDCLSRFVSGLSLNRWATTFSLAQSMAGNSGNVGNKAPPDIVEDIAIHLDALQKSLAKYEYDYSDQLESCLSQVDSNQYVFVCGESGSGKSVLLAKIASIIRPQLRTKNCNPLVVYRQIGLTRRSMNVRLLLCDLKKQIELMYAAGGRSPPSSKIPFDTTYLGIENEFEKTLAQATRQRPIFIILDGVLRLLDFYHGQNLKWLSQNRNENVHIIMSLAGQEENVANLVKTAMTNKSLPVAIYNMKPMPEEVAYDYMRKILEKNHVNPEPIVDDYLVEYARVNGNLEITSFLFLELVCRKIIKHGCREANRLPIALRSAINGVFIDAEQAVGELVVRRAIGYIASSRFGLTRLELSDLLTQDPAVSVHLRSALNLPLFLTPPAIISEILDVHLAPLIMYRKCDTWPMIAFSYTAARLQAYDRYVGTRDPATYGRELTDYFLSTWATQPRYNEAIRRYERVHLCTQPISFQPDPKWRLPASVERANHRRVDELPFAEMLAGQKLVSIDAAKGDCYINYDFLLAACRARGLAYVLDIFQWILDNRPEADEELTLVYECLKLSRTVLQRDITQLGSQICARLAGPVSKDIPLAPGDPPKLLNIRNLIRAISTHKSKPSLVASGTALMPPGKSVFIELNGGHRLPITAMAVADDNSYLLTAAKDDKMILWDLKLGGRIVRLVHHVGAEVTTLMFGRCNELALVVEPHRFSVWDLAKAERLRVLMQDFVDPLLINLIKNGQLVVSCLNNSSKISVWSLENGPNFCKVTHTVDLGEHLDSYLKSATANLLLPQNTAPDMLFLVTAQRTNFCIAWNLESSKSNSLTQLSEIEVEIIDKLAQKLRIAHKFGSIQAIGRGAEVFVVAYMAYEENNRAVISLIDLFLTSDKYQRIHSIHGCRYDEIDRLWVNQTGSHALATLKNYKTNSSHFMIWNLDTEDHKHIGSHNGITDLVAMNALQCIATADKRNSRILIWNLGLEVSRRVPKYKPRYYVTEIQRMQNYSQYAVTRTSNNGPITVWNCFLGRCAGKSVRIEHGITGDTSDVLLLRNTRLLVLTEVKSIVGGSSSDSPVRTQIFSAFRLYDIHRRVLMRRVADCIVPLGSSDDFVYYDVDRFMGLSESRQEFIVWEVNTGFQVMRIRPSFDPLLELLDPLMAKIRGRRASATRLTTAHRRFLTHLQSEHRNNIYEFSVSEDMSTIVTSHYGHFICVIEGSNNWFRHVQTITEPDSLLLLTVSALSSDGHHLVTYSYDEREKTTYVTSWLTREGRRQRRMANQRGVGALAVSKDGSVVLIGKESGEMRVWEPARHGSERIITGYPGCCFMPGKSKIWLSDDCTVAFSLTSEICAWDIVNNCVLAVFTPDVSIQCMNVALGGKMAVFGTSESTSLITLKLSTLDYVDLTTHGQDTANVFGELRDPVDDNDDFEEGGI